MQRSPDAGIPSLGMDCPQLAADSWNPPPQNRRANKSNEPRTLALGRRSNDCATIPAPEHTTEEIRT